MKPQLYKLLGKIISFQ